MTRRPEVDVAVLGVAVGVGTLPMVPVFGPLTLLTTVAAGVLLGVVVALAAARFRWGVLVTTAMALTGFLLAGPAVAVPDSTVLRVLPTPDALLAMLSGAVTSWKQVLTLTPELGTAGNVAVAPLLLALVATLVAVSLALRASRVVGTTAAVVPFVVLGLSVLLGTKVALWPAQAGVGMVLGLGTWASARVGTLAPRRVASMALVVVVVGALGAVTGPWVGEMRPRYVLRDEIVPPFDPADEPSPLSAYRKFVKDWADDELLTVSGLPDGALVRLATMDAFNGVVWDVAGAEAAEGSGTFRRVGSEVDTQARHGDAMTVELRAEALPFVWLPTVGWTRQVELADQDMRSDLRYNAATGTAVLVGGVPEGLTWSADVVVPVVPADAELEAAAVASVALPDTQQIPPAVVQFATTAAGGATSPGLVADALRDALHENGYFSHGLVDQGQAESLSGHGASRITSLLQDPERMVGDDEQYASAMALAARQLGLPARVVLGFQAPGDAGQDVTFTGSDIRAWVEIDYVGYGWVPYFPTPEENRTPDQDETPTESQAQEQIRQPPPPPAEPVTAPDDDTEQPRTDDGEEQGRDSALWALVAKVALVGGVPLVLVLGPPLLVAAVKRRRRRRRQGSEQPVERVVGGWDELLDVATDLRRPLPDQATRRELAVAIAGSFGPRGRVSAAAGRRSVGIGGPVATLASRADAVVFGGQEPTQAEVESYWAQVDAATEAMRQAVPARVRWWSRWSPRSLRRSPRGRAD